ncbi:MAG: hypothetical protein WC348_01370 [Patescibacteria group bacterium]|jgi:hypothetical protein
MTKLKNQIFWSKIVILCFLLSVLIIGSIVSDKIEGAAKENLQAILGFLAIIFFLLCFNVLNQIILKNRNRKLFSKVEKKLLPGGISVVSSHVDREGVSPAVDVYVVTNKDGVILTAYPFVNREPNFVPQSNYFNKCQILALNHCVPPCPEIWPTFKCKALPYQFKVFAGLFFDHDKDVEENFDRFEWLVWFHGSNKFQKSKRQEKTVNFNGDKTVILKISGQVVESIPLGKDWQRFVIDVGHFLPFYVTFDYVDRDIQINDFVESIQLDPENFSSVISEAPIIAAPQKLV